MTYAIQHVTRFSYHAAVSESQMEVRMQPRTDQRQSCLGFDLRVEPHARLLSYRDFLGNWVHHFSVPRPHQQLTITARARVEVEPPADIPQTLDLSAWSAIDDWARQGEHWDLRQPSHFAAWTDRLMAYADSIASVRERSLDPLSTSRAVMAAIHHDFAYMPKSTRVDSPIDEALDAHKGVCQDFAHIMLAILRRIGLPSRYVSGYIAPPTAEDASRVAEGATHAWVEVLLPEVGWLGLDPTNNTTAGLRHVCVAVGRDYADVSPTRGVFKGDATSALLVSVDVRAAEPSAGFEPPPLETSAPAVGVQSAARSTLDHHRQMQQQQQQRS